MNQKYFTVCGLSEVTIFKGVVLKKWRKKSRLAYPDFLQVKQVKHKDLDCYFALFFWTGFLHRSPFFSSIRSTKGNIFYV